MIIPVHNLIWDAAQGNVPSMVLHEKLYEPHYTQGYQPTCRSTPWNGITLKVCDNSHLANFTRDIPYIHKSLSQIRIKPAENEVCYWEHNHSY